jgi:hypothetical protein
MVNPRMRGDEPRETLVPKNAQKWSELGIQAFKKSIRKLSSGILSVYGFRKASIIISFSCPLARECFFHFPNQPSYKKRKDDVQQTMK